MTDDDEEDRTPAFGIFSFARAYWSAGAHLADTKLGDGHRDAPVQFLLSHSVELYLKALLRLRGYSVKRLRKLRHDVATLAELAEAEGLELDDEDVEVIGLIVSSGILLTSLSVGRARARDAQRLDVLGGAMTD